MILLSAAIVYDCKELINILLDGEYEIMKPDLENKMLFIYACQSNQIEWINKIISLTRKDILTNFVLCANLAKNNNDIGAPTINSNFQNNFNVNSFIKNILSIIDPLSND